MTLQRSMVGMADMDSRTKTSCRDREGEGRILASTTCGLASVSESGHLLTEKKKKIAIKQNLLAAHKFDEVNDKLEKI